MENDKIELINFDYEKEKAKAKKAINDSIEQQKKKLRRPTS
jgi:hypothetical protein